MKFILPFIVFLVSFGSQAEHIIGGEIYYDYLGNNRYLFYISIYRDCNSNGAQFDNPLYLSVYNSGNTLIQNIEVSFPGSQYVPVAFNNPCVTPPSDICTEHALYTTVLTLPPIPGGYVVSYQRCCRGPEIDNILYPEDNGFTLTCTVPGTNNNNYINSSPRFNSYPPLLLCNNEDLIFDHSATDPDGDQLVYSLVTPYAGASGSSWQPNPIPPPPYGTVSWLPGFNAANPLGPGATINIDPNTGILTASPNLIGRFVVGIQVEEIRNGVVINRTARDFIFQVFNCNLQLEAILPTQEQLPTFVSYCQGLTVAFVNNSYGGTNYEWDFGDPATTNDISNAFAPTYTYSASGHYTAMLVVNPNWPCTDTAYMDVYVNDEIQVSFLSEDSLCVLDNNFNFTAVTNGPPGTIFFWDFGPNATIQTATGQTVNNVTFNTYGNITVTLEAENNLCVSTYSEDIYVLAEPIAEIVTPDEIECAGLTINFGNNSQNGTQHNWDFGVSGTNTDVSTETAPTFSYPEPGNYTVTLISGSSPNCLDTTTVDIELNEPLLVSFTSEDSLCLTDNAFNFDGTVSGPPGSVFTWEFGPNASIQTSNDTDVPNVQFNTTGFFPITLTGNFENCVESVVQEIYVITPPTIDFTIEPGLQCVPFTAQFVDLSFAETQIFYHWDFGDNITSTLQHPSHTYIDSGTFNVTLSIRTTSGCVDSISLMRADLVNVNPNPTAGFSIDKDYMDICHSTVHFTDESVDATEWFYWFDETTFFSEDQYAAHTYIRDGWHYPYQIVTNEFGCKDTSGITPLYIEPFPLYVPNTFTPDGDDFNNVFQPVVYLPVERWKLQIFNRWGALIFESEDVNDFWNGTTPDGSSAQDGTYSWKITYVSCEPINPERSINGNVNLIR